MRTLPRLQLLIPPLFNLSSLPCVLVLSKDHPSISLEDFAGSGAHGFLDLPTDITMILGHLDMDWANLPEGKADERDEGVRTMGVNRRRGEIVEVRVRVKGMKVS